MAPEEVKAWLFILRDFLLVVVGTFMLVYETLEVRPPSIDVLSVGAALLGIPMVVRLDTWSSGKDATKPSRRKPPPEGS